MCNQINSIFELENCDPIIHSTTEHIEWRHSWDAHDNLFNSNFKQIQAIANHSYCLFHYLTVCLSFALCISLLQQWRYDTNFEAWNWLKSVKCLHCRTITTTSLNSSIFERAKCEMWRYNVNPIKRNDENMKWQHEKHIMKVLQVCSWR